MLLDIVLWFALLSLLSVGGMSAIMPEVQRVVVEINHWVTPAEFTQLFAVSQAAPGPNVLISSLIGWKVAGIPGALAAFAAFALPASVLAWYVAGVWQRFNDAPWRATVQRALLPVTVGLVLSGGYVLGTPLGLDWRNALIMGASAAMIYATRLNPLWLLAGGGLLGYFLL
jgi:chromate transporter